MRGNKIHEVDGWFQARAWTLKEAIADLAGAHMTREELCQWALGFLTQGGASAPSPRVVEAHADYAEIMLRKQRRALGGDL